ncbi:MAG TPA: YetF domain-containing protein, partial [Bacillota bacterium]|nr:YetF domain-containing protein [Bacillota bacterium]
MELLVYVFRCLEMALTVWVCTRVIGKRSIAQMTAYDLAIMLILANIAAEPLVYKISSKAMVGSFAVTVVAIFIGWLSLRKVFYNLDSKPSIIIANGKIDKEELKKNRLNLPFLFSLLRLKGYAAIADVEFAILEPDGNLSVLPKSQSRPVLPRDLQINTEYEGLAL